jgi:hypothetical protein
VHRAILKQAAKVHPRFFVIAGDVLKYNYKTEGTPDAVLRDYRKIFGSKKHPLDFWPVAPGPVIFPVVGGHDEQYFLDPELAKAAEASRGKRYAYEGTPELGMQLYDAFNLDQMRIRAQPLREIGRPLPMSPVGDYLVISGEGERRELALLVLYRSDRWGFRADQVDWVDSVLSDFRRDSPEVPLIVVGHDWTWFLPDTLDDGHLDGANNGVRTESAELDRLQKRRLAESLKVHHADLEVAADSHEYWVEISDELLKVNCAAAICKDPFGDKVATDNVWLDYEQSGKALRVTVNPINPPVGCGLRPEAAARGLAFEKKRAAGSNWRRLDPDSNDGAEHGH